MSDLGPPLSAREYLSRNLFRCANWRRTAVNAVIRLIPFYGTHDETAAHAIETLDRFLSCKLKEFQNLPDYLYNEFQSRTDFWKYPDHCGSVCFLLAVKLKETSCPSVGELVQIVGQGLNAPRLLQFEVEVLTTLEWDLQSTTGDFAFGGNASNSVICDIVWSQSSRRPHDVNGLSFPHCSL